MTRVADLQHWLEEHSMLVGTDAFERAEARLAAEVEGLGAHPRRYDQCDGTCTVDCGHCKGVGTAISRPKGVGVRVPALDDVAFRRLWGRPNDWSSSHLTDEQVATDAKKCADCCNCWRHRVIGVAGEGCKGQACEGGACLVVKASEPTRPKATCLPGKTLGPTRPKDQPRLPSDTPSAIERTLGTVQRVLPSRQPRRGGQRG